jgi:hypothetical protein
MLLRRDAAEHLEESGPSLQEFLEREDVVPRRERGS